MNTNEFSFNLRKCFCNWVKLSAVFSAFAVFMPTFLLAQTDMPPSLPSIENALSWSDPSTWGGQLPQGGEDVVIPQGATIVLDTDTPAFGNITINGNLLFARRDIRLRAAGITVNGIFAIGTREAPFQHHATLTLTGAVSNRHSARGIAVNGGTLALFGQRPAVAWTKINAHAQAGTRRLQLMENVDWRSNDEIIIAPTDFYNVAATERLTLASVNGDKLELKTPLRRSRWGQLQYLTRTGISLTPGKLPKLPADNVPTVLDERAEVGNISRNIRIEGADDDTWQKKGFGAHIMVMGAKASAWIQGVEMRRAGQAGRLARYPIHFHNLSYNSDGDELPKGGSRVIRYNAISDSTNRCIAVHGTNDVIIDHNICHKILGHAIFLEDAVERRNTITNNLVLNVRFPAPGDRLLKSDSRGDNTGSAGFWLTNPDNYVAGNTAADAEGNGFWMAYPDRPLGSNYNVPLRPRFMQTRMFANNTAHSNGAVNFQLDFAPINNQGEVRPMQYHPTVDGREGSRPARFTYSGLSSWKGEGVWNRPEGATFVGWVSADNIGMFFAGSGLHGRIRSMLVIGESLNNATTWRDINKHAPPTAFASYHSAYNMQDNVLVNFPLYPGPEFRANGGSQISHGGMLETRDFYTRPVDLGNVRIKNNVLINTHPGFRVRKPDAPRAHWTLAGALWDPHGYWGPQGNYWVYDMPFLTAGTECVSVPPVGKNGMSCKGPYYGLTDFGGYLVRDNPRRGMLKTLDVRRVDSNMKEIDRWLVRDGRTGDGFFDIMRHAALVKNGRFYFNLSHDIKGKERPFIPEGDLFFELANFTRETDMVIIGIPFNTSQPLKGFISSFGNPDRMRDDRPEQIVALSPVKTRAELENGGGDGMWIDQDQQKVWVKVVSPARYDRPLDTDTVELNELHRGVYVRLFNCEHIQQHSAAFDVARRVCE